jgi:hypothetical protein
MQHMMEESPDAILRGLLPLAWVLRATAAMADEAPNVRSAAVRTLRELGERRA